ncbi:carboxypeptidase-like regulatory domain-containing protein [Hymenobacter sp. 15J16-1T3B]|uniref:carboxypeptidase-like regulatory domain-containing protein n=1 Tax=Hymenobacter sp. 15J16-1T3B TaxID=2886941 RepID=UPI001D0FA8F5|nr:carboxypeptidase-like regulatory domain-containing protein [Hymenobacter sp. 15J16-1T3B]MCC3156298.1 carboxypeptidase-like regulatory domain-containing protein [Hymenobacter sp. 15J16-1T3B]
MKHLATLLIGLLPLAAVAQTQPAAARPDSTQNAAAQPATLGCNMLTGRITDAFAYPLTGATVMLRSRDRSFATDAFSTNAEGRYLVTSKKPIPRDVVLFITAAGYTTLEQPLTNCQPLEVTLEPLPGTKFKSDGRIKKTSNTGKIR